MITGECDSLVIREIFSRRNKPVAKDTSFCPDIPLRVYYCYLHLGINTFSSGYQEDH